MEPHIKLPIFVWMLFVFILGTGVGSFINVLVVRLPFYKSIVWPSSRCLSCLSPIQLLDNLPIIGYLRLRGRCRNCGAKFPASYMWVELFTGLAFVALYLVEIVFNWHKMPGLEEPINKLAWGIPSLPIIGLFASHACLLSLLIACSLVDFRYRVIPAPITYTGTLLGLIFSTIMPWPWPNVAPAILANVPSADWILPKNLLSIPTGSTLWPVWGPLPSWAPAGSTMLGLLNGLVGAAVGMLIGRGIKLMFELGMGREALGLGDADLMMMAGAFLGWQAIVLSLFVGAFLTLFVVIPQKIVGAVRGRNSGSELPFGPGIAAGIVTCWFTWPWLREILQTMVFDAFIIVFFVLILGGGMLISGLFLRKDTKPASPGVPT